jgi:hypothetical protein
MARLIRSGACHHLLVRLVIGLSATVCCGAPAAADPIAVRITSGAVEILHGQDLATASFALTGSDFELHGSGTSSICGGAVGDLCLGSISLSSSVGAHFGSVTYPGLLITEFSLLTSGSGSLNLASAVVATPENASGSIAVQQPFELRQSSFVSPRQPQLPGVPEFLQFDLFGSGQATGTFLLQSTAFGTQHILQQVRYEFADTPAATPEPGTFLLIGSGVVALWRRERRKMRTRYV